MSNNQDNSAYMGLAFVGVIVAFTVFLLSILALVIVFISVVLTMLFKSSDPNFRTPMTVRDFKFLGLGLLLCIPLVAVLNGLLPHDSFHKRATQEWVQAFKLAVTVCVFFAPYIVDNDNYLETRLSGWWNRKSIETADYWASKGVGSEAPQQMIGADDSASNEARGPTKFNVPPQDRQ